jgi:hypothetical protein
MCVCVGKFKLVQPTTKEKTTYEMWAHVDLTYNKQPPPKKKGGPR